VDVGELVQQALSVYGARASMLRGSESVTLEFNNTPEINIVVDGDRILFWSSIRGREDNVIQSAEISDALVSIGHDLERFGTFSFSFYNQDILILSAINKVNIQGHLEMATVLGLFYDYVHIYSNYFSGI
jgi:hypothetical protein